MHYGGTVFRTCKPPSDDDNHCRKLQLIYLLLEVFDKLVVEVIQFFDVCDEVREGDNFLDLRGQLMPQPDGKEETD